MSIEDVKVLIRQEKEYEQKIAKAKEEADGIIKKSEKDAQRILQNANDPKYYDDIFTKGLAEISDKKKVIEKETDRKIERIRDKAKKNLEKTSALVLKRVLEG